MRSVETLVIGAGQAGLSLSGYLTRAGRSHAVLERGRIGERWRSERWESLTLLTPNWLNRLHGGHDARRADGYLAARAFVRLPAHAPRSTNRAPVREHAASCALKGLPRPRISGRHQSTGAWHAGNVVVATGE